MRNINSLISASLLLNFKPKKYLNLLKIIDIWAKNAIWSVMKTLYHFLSLFYQKNENPPKTPYEVFTKNS